MSYTTEGASNGWRQDRRWGNRGRCGGFARWRPLELVAMILGFVVFWPIGLAIIGFKVWQKRSGYGGDVFTFAEERTRAAREACRSWRGTGGAATGGGWGPRATGNSAFDAWRDAELSRLEEERRKLEAAEKEFSDYIEQLRRARDREQFEQFMRERQSRGPQSSGPDSEGPRPSA